MEQGSDEWLDVRRGKFTASIASKLLTQTGKLSTQWHGEVGRIIAEHMGIQEPEPYMSTVWMERGTDLEAEARLWFTVETHLDVEEVGFIEGNSGMMGASPDGLIKLPLGEQRIPLELKVPKPSTHIGWLLKGGLPAEHKQQVHFTMVLMDAPYAYFQSYSPDLEPLIVKVERDDYTEQMRAAMEFYCGEFKAAYKRITGREYER
jgi:hypothetical protein